MLRFELSQDQKHFELKRYDLRSELNSLRLYFRKKKSSQYSPFARRKQSASYHSFITQDNKIGSGLWKEIIKFSKKSGFDVDIDGIEDLVNFEITKEKIEKFSQVLLDGCPSVPELRPYQLEAAYRGLKYKMCTQELATSGGKTVIFYIYLAYLKRKGFISKDKKAILIVPNIKLVTQTNAAFKDEYHTGLIDFDIMMLGGDHSFKQKKFDDCELLITTYQSLGDRPKEFFSNFNVVCIDECHFTRGKTIQSVLDYSKNAKYKMGLSGTIKIKEDHLDFFKIQEKLGPLMLTVSAKHLQENKYSADVDIRVINLIYEIDDFIRRYTELKESVKDNFDARASMGKELYAMEKAYIIASESRLDYISEMTKKLSGGNTLILFIDIKNKYGSRLHEKISKWNQHCYYIDGAVKEGQRSEYQNIMESNKGVVLVASYGTFSTGINLKNLDYIIFAESYKSEIIVRQSIGRGMRLIKDKTKVIVFDIVDVLLEGETSWMKNTVLKHSLERIKIYKKQGWPVRSFRIPVLN